MRVSRLSTGLRGQVTRGTAAVVALRSVELPINLAAALNVLSDGSIAAAVAQQQTPIDQSTGIAPPPGFTT